MSCSFPITTDYFALEVPLLTVASFGTRFALRKYWPTNKIWVRNLVSVLIPSVLYFSGVALAVYPTASIDTLIAFAIPLSLFFFWSTANTHGLKRGVLFSFAITIALAILLLFYFFVQNKIEQQTHKPITDELSIDLSSYCRQPDNYLLPKTIW